MKRSTHYACSCVALGTALCASAFAAGGEAVDSAQAKAKLAEIRERISALTTRLSGELKDRDSLAARLRTADLAITADRQRLAILHGAQIAAQQRREALRVDEIRNRNALEAQRAALASQARAAYMMGQHQEIELLLNQSDPASAGRMLTFYGFLARARVAKIDEIRERVLRARQMVADIEQTTAKLQALQVATAAEMTDLRQAREERWAALSAVTRQVSSGSQELGRLQREAQAEEALVADVARVLQDFPVDTQQSFAELRGNLPWPVQGRVAVRYRAGTDADAGLKRNGVLIDGMRGAKVRAPYFGRVVYADWLQGLGLLLIIGHTGNYMTLYGHAEVLYKSVGDWVAPGDVIAALPDSTGVAPQLYFEIRDGRTPKDPMAWLKATP